MLLRFSRLGAAFILPIALAACGSDSTEPPVAPGFLGGTSTNHQIGVVLNSVAKTVTMFQVGSPTTQQQIALGTSSTVTPTGLSVRGRRAAIPLGDAASVAFVNLESGQIARFFTFATGNATGSAFVDDTTVVAANLLENQVGKFTANQSGNAIGSLVTVAPQPTAITVSGGRALVVSSNLGADFMPIGPGIVTAIDTKTMQVVGTATMGGNNSTDAAIGPDGLLYVLNSEDFFLTQASITIVNPATMSVVTTIPNIGIAAGAIYIDPAGLAYISSFSGGTTVWNTATRTFVRGPDNPICAKVADGSCRGAFAATTDAQGNVYQAFFGSASQNQPPYVFVFKAGTFALTDSVSIGQGPSALVIRTF